MTITNGYTTLQKLQEHLGRETAEGQESGASDLKASRLEECITLASAMINNWLGIPTHLNMQTVTNEKIDRYACSDLGFSISNDLEKIRACVPIISVTSIVESGITLTEDTDFYVYGKSKKIERNGTWSGDRKAIVFSGVIGHATIPAEIESCCLQIAAAISGLSITAYEDDNGDMTTVIQRSVPKWVFQTIDTYRDIYL